MSILYGQYDGLTYIRNVILSATLLLILLLSGNQTGILYHIMKVLNYMDQIVC